MQETLVNCGLLACVARARRSRREAAYDARARCSRRRIRVGSVHQQAQKIFLDNFAESHRRRPDRDRDRAKITRNQFASASSRATAKTIGAHENGCRSVRNTTVRRTIRPRERCLDAALGPSRRPRDAAEAFIRGDRAADATRCDGSPVENRDGAADPRSEGVVWPYRAAGRARQIPSFALSMSLTACGFALPPDAFITWPTNQPISFGLGLRLRDLVGVGGDDVVDGCSRSRRVGHLLHAARLDDGARIAALAPHDLEQVLGDLARDRALADQVDDARRAARRRPATRRCPCPPC